MKKTILAILMVLSSGIATQASADEMNAVPVMIENQYRDVIEFQFVRDGQTLASCRIPERYTCELQADILPGHQNQIVVLDSRGPISAREITDSNLRWLFTADGQLMNLRGR